MTPDLPRLVVVRAVVRAPSNTPGHRWETTVVGWLADPGRLYCSAHPASRECEHMCLVREAINNGRTP